MKIYGNYYKNTIHGKIQEPFELELATDSQELGVLRELATPILREKDIEFRGIRELQISKSIEMKATFDNKLKTEKKRINKVLDNPEIRQKAKSLKIKNYWNRKIEDLIKLIEEKENALEERKE